MHKLLFMKDEMQNPPLFRFYSIKHSSLQQNDHNAPRILFTKGKYLQNSKTVATLSAAIK